MTLNINDMSDDDLVNHMLAYIKYVCFQRIGCYVEGTDEQMVMLEISKRFMQYKWHIDDAEARVESFLSWTE